MSPTPLPMDFTATGDRLRAPSRFEAVLLGLILLLGLGLRSLRPEAMAVEHFDEGVYASNLYCGHLDPPFAYPMRHLYAPPLFPALLDWAQILAGPGAVMWVNVLLGSLMVAAVWWTTRCWFGPAAAIAAALLAATSEYHIAFSRMALTDVPLSLLMLLGVFAGWRAVLAGRPLWIAAAGLLAGLAWCTKYNGWLTLAVTGSGTLAFFFVQKFLLGDALSARLRPGGEQTIANCKLQIANCELGAAVVRWGLTAALAGVVFWVFVLRDLAPVGGYAAVAKNHAGYFVGFGGWWSGLLRQRAAQAHVMGWTTCLGIAAAWGGGASVRLLSGGDSPRLAPWVQAGLVGVVLVMAARFLTAGGLLAISALVGFACAARQAAASDHDPRVERLPARLAAWMLLAWFVGLLVAVPLYFPYPRLSLPWVVVCWPLSGVAISSLADRLFRRHGHGSADSETDTALPVGQSRLSAAAAASAPAVRRPVSLKKVILVSGIAVLILSPLTLIDFDQVQRGIVNWPPAWQSRTSIQDTARKASAPINSRLAAGGADAEHGIAAVVYVAGDPAMFYQLSRLQRPGIVIQPIADAGGLRPTAGTPTFLISRAPVDAPESGDPHLQFLGSRSVHASDMVLLDGQPASELQNRERRPREELRLYEVR